MRRIYCRLTAISYQLTYGSNTAYYNSSAWHNFKICADYTNQTVAYYLDNALLGTASFSDVGIDVISNRLTYLRFVSYANSSKELLFDNFRAYYTPMPRIVGAEFTDSAGKACQNGSFVYGLCEIRIKFNTAMDGNSLKNAVILKKNEESIEYSGTYDGRSRTYVLSPVSGDCFDSPAYYTVTVSETALSSDGRALYENAEFYAAVGNNDVRVTGFDISPQGGNVYDISALIINGDTECSGATMIFALYDGERLVNAGTERIPLTFGLNNISKQLDASGMEYDEVKAFIWSSLDTAVPYAEAAVLSGVTAEDFSRKEISAPLRNESVTDYVSETFPDTGSDDYAMRLERIGGTGIADGTKRMHNIDFIWDMSDDELYPAYAKAEGKTVIAFDYLSNNNNNVELQYHNNSTE
ncbi:MAG: hypothetical protein ACI4DP_10110, partial [Candidatus Ornithomonoglobus sp.]